MNNQEMINRYLYAATKDLPANTRDDVARELESLIDDLLAERCGDAAPTTADLKAVLAEIGAPDEVYARYSPDGGQSLIGPPYYAKYKLMLKVVLYCVGLSMVVFGLVSMFAARHNVWEGVSNWIGLVMNGLVYGFAAVTIVFAVLQRKQVGLSAVGFDFDSLPAVPAKGKRISRGDSVAEIVLSVVFTIVFIFFPQIFSFFKDGAGGTVFNVEVLQSRWPLLVIACALSLAAATFGLFEGLYTLRFAIVQLACNVGGFIVTVLFLRGPGIINADFILVIGEVIESDVVLRPLSNLNVVIIGIVAVSMILESATSFRKALQHSA